MNIIFGTAEVAKLQEKYIVLELDTVTIRSSSPITAYCVVENLPLEEFAKVEVFKKLHTDLMDNYRKRNWHFCIQAIDTLMGFWGKQIDSFYQVLKTRILAYIESEPDTAWTGVIPKG